MIYTLTNLSRTRVFRLETVLVSAAPGSLLHRNRIGNVSVCISHLEIKKLEESVTHSVKSTCSNWFELKRNCMRRALRSRFEHLFNISFWRFGRLRSKDKFWEESLDQAWLLESPISHTPPPLRSNLTVKVYGCNGFTIESYLVQTAPKWRGTIDKYRTCNQPLIGPWW